jgi:RNA polymerase sigma-70 factor, ECF subfamily
VRSHRSSSDDRRVSGPSSVEGGVGSVADPEDSNAALWVAPGDPDEVLRDFFDLSLGEVYGYLLRRCGHDRATAEDLTQDTFVTAVRTLQDGQIDRLTVAWLIRCAQSRFIDHCRREGRRMRHLRVVSSTEADPLDDGVIGELLVEEQLADLPSSQRLVVVLHHLDGLTVPQVAERLGRSVRAVESSLSRARRTMRRRVEGSTDDR